MRYQCLHTIFLITGLLFQFIQVSLLNGQSTDRVDSLRNRLVFMIDDSSKVDALVQISRQYLGQSELDLSEKYLEQLKKLSTSLHHEEGLSHYYCISGLVSYNRGEFSDALTRLNTSLQMCEKRKDQKGMA